jgi:hypothetical protein
MSDIIRLVGPMDDLDARVQHERNLADFRDDDGHLIIVPGRDGHALAIRPGSELSGIVNAVNAARKKRDG